jgi:hypothetical protein
MEFDKDNYFGSGKTLKNAIKKYGDENFIMGIIEYINPNEWQEKERDWIKKMNSHTSLGGYNQTWGGDGTLGLKMEHSSKIKMANIARNRSDETKEKIKKSILLKRDEINKNISKALKGRKLSGNSLISAQTAFLGKTHTNETKQKIGLKHKGKKLSDETKLKLRIFNLGKKMSNETKTKISLKTKGKKKSEETKQKMSNGKKSIKRSTKICLYCQREISDGNFQRWHGEKCKMFNRI